MRRAFRAAVVVFALLAIPVVSACGDNGKASDEPSFPTVTTLGQGDLFPEVRNSSLGVGINRFAVSLTDKGDQKVLDASVRLAFYDLNDRKPALKADTGTRLVRIQNSFVNEDEGGQRTVTGEDGVYATQVTFDRAGQWGVQIYVTRGGQEMKPIPFTFTVREKTPEPAIGDAAPPSVQATTATDDIERIDSSSPTRPAMHDITVADALKTGKPLVVAFATPAFCETRTCAPVMDTVMDPLAAEFAGQALFIHIEPYDLAALRETGQANPVHATLEWGLQSEPWIFVVGRDGKIAGKYEGIVSPDEVRDTLRQALAETPRGASPAP
ncbi:MAG TPA: hypothetical protein VFC53_06755 [Dehalococcoidia bacterium]|nr:hypothetical protein [Dehalococcoidia bacterium]